MDVACLQELAPNQARAVEAVLPHGKLEPASDPADCSGMGIALRRPGTVHHLSLRRRDARVVELLPEHWPELPVPMEVLNLHVQAPHSRPPWRSFPERRAQIRAVLRYLSQVPLPHRVLAGDLNATPLWPAYRRLAELLGDAPAQHARSRGERPPRTWSPLPGWRPWLRIDHVLVAGLGVAHSQVLPLAGSDHRALLVELELPAPRPPPVRSGSRVASGRARADRTSNPV